MACSTVPWSLWWAGERCSTSSSVTSRLFWSLACFPVVSPQNLCMLPCIESLSEQYHLLCCWRNRFREKQIQCLLLFLCSSSGYCVLSVIVLSIGTVCYCVWCLVYCPPCKQLQHPSLLEGVTFQNFCRWNRCGELRNGHFILLLPNSLLPPSSARSRLCQYTKADGIVSVRLWDLSF